MNDIELKNIRDRLNNEINECNRQIGVWMRRRSTCEGAIDLVKQNWEANAKEQAKTGDIDI